MVRIITAQNIVSHDHLMEKVWRFRHRQFVERLGWHELAQEDGRERDQFDGSDAIHLVLERQGRVIGYSRLLRTSGPHLLSDIYPEIMDGRPWPRADDIYEWTRCIADPDADPIGNVPASHFLITAVLEFCLLAGIRGLVVETHPKLVEWMRYTGYCVDPLNDAKRIKDALVVPVHIATSVTALARHRTLFGIGRTTLDLDPGLVNPVSGTGLMSIPNPVTFVNIPPEPLPDIDFSAMQRPVGE